MTSETADSSVEKECLEVPDSDCMEGVHSLSKTASEAHFTSLEDSGSLTDEEPPEEILNSVARKKVEEEGLLQPEFDQKLCAMCQKIPHKYRCPKCDMRTCSLPCSKQHKDVKKCDGIRPLYQPLSKLSQFDASKSIQDQQFLHAVRNNMSGANVNSSIPPNQQEPCESVSSKMYIENAEGAIGPVLNIMDSAQEVTGGLRYAASSPQERYLMQNALRRRIWLCFADDKGGEDLSRHEQFSDTIFWCVDFVFTKQLEDGTASEYIYRVQNIPETIRLETVLRQFLKPRQHGCVVSKSDLDLEKMAPFIEVGIESINGFMLVPNVKPERYYGINFGKDLLHNTRNRLIVNHPRIIITLNTEFTSSHQLISELEAEDIREKQRLSRAMYRAAEATNSGGFDRTALRRGRDGSRGCHRGQFRGDFSGSNGSQRDHSLQQGGFRGGFKGSFNRKRCNFNDGGPRHNRKWRAVSSSRRQHDHNYRSLDGDFDPFEPFEGPVRLPRSYLGSGKTKNTESAHADKKSPNNITTEQGDAMKTWGECIAQREKSSCSSMPG